ncbi:MAG: hypothetical protein KDF65_13040, partial [Anaerolineae bacterium]|nr:hypothetical protein [Anaerolineae bacterium]
RRGPPGLPKKRRQTGPPVARPHQARGKAPPPLAREGPGEATLGQTGAGKGGALFINSQAATSQTDNNYVQGTLTYLKSGYLIIADEGVFSDPVVIEYEPQAPPNIDGWQHVGLFYDLNATYLANGLPAQPGSGKQYTITVNYHQEDVPLDVDEAALAFYFWNGSTWNKEPNSQVDPDANIIPATPAHFSLWAALSQDPIISSPDWPVYS